MKVVVCEKKEIHLSDGPKLAGAVVDIPDRVAERYLAAGAVERYETKVVREVPLADAGSAEPLSASPVAQASTGMTLSASDAGAMESRTYPVDLVLAKNPPTPEETIAKLAKKRGRPRKV